MNRKLVLLTALVILVGTLGLASKAQRGEACGTIYIRANGDVEGTDKIDRVGEYGYIFIDNINDSIVVERDNIVVDGAGYILQGAGSGAGTGLSNRSNVTIKNMEIKAFQYGVWLSYSSNNSIYGNNLTNNVLGIALGDSSNNSIYGNDIVANNYCSIALGDSSNNRIHGNNMTNSDYGIYLSASSNNSISGNSIRANNKIGVRLVESSNYNSFSANTVTNYGDGICLEDSSNHNSISGNTVTANNGHGIMLDYSLNNSITGNELTINNKDGIYLWKSSSNNISVNNITANLWDGIGLSRSPGNSFSGNNVTNNGLGIVLSFSSNSSLKGNSIANNKYNFGAHGSSLTDFVNDVDVSNTVDDKPVYYWINREDVTVPLDSGYVALVNCTRVTIQDLKITSNWQGILLAYTINSTITKNGMTNNNQGISFYGASNNSISGNNIRNNEMGIVLDYSSSHNSIFGNNITDNRDAGYGPGITVGGSSNYNHICGNDIMRNDYAVAFDSSSGNEFYHNNFIDNTRLVRFYTSGYAHIWDNGYPSGGNYWSDYTGVDLDHDGIGDTEYVLDVNNQDNYPLMAPINFFDAGTWNDITYYVHTVSNSTVSDFYFNPNVGPVLYFSVTGSDGTTGFSRVAIPKELLWVENGWVVLVGGEPAVPTVSEDAEYTYLYFTYSHSTKTVEITGTDVIPEFPSFLILPPFMLATLLAVIVYRRQKTVEKRNANA